MATQQETKLWADRLGELLQRGAAASAAQDGGRIASVQRDLRRFKEESPDFVDSLDRQATLAIFDLDLQATEDAVSAIRERAEEVRRLTKLISGVAEEAKANARGLRGEAAIKAIEGATGAIASFRQLRDELNMDDVSERSVADQVDQVLSAVQGLRNLLERH
ncbi:hypothetical protein [Variovorax rhizosphaerae]|uniref:Chemotaxis protein n=1 Tax=Variovorax rhizosphaerae TaxID=1836200 RepID=A0ABU8WQB8_9BURK